MAISTVEQIGRQAFEHFRQGLATGEWVAFLDMLTDDFTLTFPKGKFAGTHHGKDKATEFFGFVRKAYPEGLFITNLQTVAVGENTVMFEFQDEGKLFDQPYQGRVVIALDVRGDKISGYREYFGME
ncbi:MAG: nuclear transport factor 2 family protein [Aggregatilineales bacterium]